MEKSDLPFGSEFSPSNIDLKTVLEFAVKHGGDAKAFENAIHDRFFSSKKFPNTSEYNRRKRANNTNLGLRAYGLVDKAANLTDISKQLHEVRDNESELYARLGRHILLNLHGSTLVQTIQDMEAAGQSSVVEVPILRRHYETLSGRPPLHCNSIYRLRRRNQLQGHL